MTRRNLIRLESKNHTIYRYPLQSCRVAALYLGEQSLLHFFWSIGLLYYIRSSVLIVIQHKVFTLSIKHATKLSSNSMQDQNITWKKFDSRVYSWLDWQALSMTISDLTISTESYPREEINHWFNFSFSLFFHPFSPSSIIILISKLLNLLFWIFLRLRLKNA